MQVGAHTVSNCAWTGGHRNRSDITIDCFAGLSREALYRTRTDDPFLTMEVLYQLS